MSLTVTISILVAALVVGAFANYKSRQPVEIGKTRWIPYLGVQFVAILAVILMAAHLVTLLTGVPLVGRFSR